MKVQIKVPSAGESITEGVLLEWFKEDGEYVNVDDPLFELETDKITMTVQAETAGQLSIQVEADTTVEMGQVVGELDTSAKPAAGAAASAPVATPEASAAPAVAAAPAGNQSGAGLPLSPATARIVAETGTDPSSIAGTGKDGRLTKGDVIQALEQKPAAPALATSSASAPAQPRGERETRTKMSRLRQRLAERLVSVQHETAMLTTFNEVDMSPIMNLRKQYQDAFVKKNGTKLGFMSFFIKAVVDALQTVPEVNARIEGDEVVQQHYYDISVAVSTPRGLVVPVIRDADKMGFAEIEQKLIELATKARDGKLALDDMTGGVYTVSNGGIYGSLLSTPILNPPQSGILGMHAIKKRPIEVNDQIVLRPMMNLAMSYDHRLIDGKEAVTFLKRVVECLENPERMLLEV